MSSGNVLAGSGEWWIDRGKLFPTRDNYPFHESNRTLPYRNLGLVKVAREHKFITVTWDVDAAHQASIDYCLQFLEDQTQVKIVTLQFCKSAWAKETLPVHEAIERIQEIQTFSAVDILKTTRIKPLDTSSMGSFDPMIRIAFREWQFNRSDLKSQVIADYGLFFVRQDDGLLFERIGELSECRKMLGDEWKATARGTPCDSAFADSEFDRRISSSYHQCYLENRPILEHLHGLIDVGAYSIWLPYQRALLPLDDGLACFTKITQDISIPFLRAA